MCYSVEIGPWTNIPTVCPIFLTVHAGFAKATVHHLLVAFASPACIATTDISLLCDVVQIDRQEMITAVKFIRINLERLLFSSVTML